MIRVDVSESPRVASAANQPTPRSGRFSVIAWIWIGTVVGLGSLAAVAELPQWHSEDSLRLLAYFLAAALTSLWKVRLPHVRGTMSVSFFFILLSVVELTAGETMALAAGCSLIQYLWKGRAQKPVQAVFNASSALLAAYLTHAVFVWPLLTDAGFQFPLRMGAAALVYFLMNSAPIAIVVRLTEGKPVLETWRDCYAWSFAYYLLGSGVAGMLSALNARVGWQATVLVIPVVFIVYRSYSGYVERLEAEKNHAEGTAALHLRTLEALAMAIEAKEQVTHDHLRRVQVYSTEVGKELGMPETELQALIAASLLHDIGKLAVPEHILSKPGRLTPEEFAKVKIHPVVGAAILERVKFPYPVASLVRHHHERWDGSGYPDGLRAAAIPLGARILAAVDCLDALATDREYRPALSLDKAMDYLVTESGKAFDPQVVRVLARSYKEFEVLTRSTTVDEAQKPLIEEAKVERGGVPDLGFINQTVIHPGESTEFISTIAAAREEARVLFEMSRDLVTGLNLAATMQAVDERIGALVPHDSLAVYLRRQANGNSVEDQLICEYATGQDAATLSVLAVQSGHGVAGWVAENRNPILNANPVEAGYLSDANGSLTLHSAVVIPLEGNGGVIGVLALYATGKEAFTQDHLRVLQVVAPRLTLALENIRLYSSVECGAGTDYLTGLPNARGLFAHLETVLADSGEAGAVSVIVADLDGFKAVNDQFGHLEGNRLLQHAADVFRQKSRVGDYISRMGGDEFVFVLPATRLDEGERISLRLRQSLEEAATAVLGTSILSMSVGVASYPASGSTPELILAEADRLMYIDKRKRKSHRTVSLAGLATAVDNAHDDQGSEVNSPAASAQQPLARRVDPTEQ
jgi:diguanylate cyclase (GGDEF)-like protein/putative nucleotidyltransferase with HDIG domain